MTPPLATRARVLLTEGKVVGIPTDTVYGLAAHRWAQSELFRLKDRPADKAIPVLVGSMADALSSAAFPATARQLADAHWPGPLTLVLAVKPGAGNPDGLTIGLRMPDHPLTLDLLTLCGPLAVTSANRSGGVPALSDGEAQNTFGDQVEIYLPGICPGGVASTVIEVLPGQDPRILRAGPIRFDPVDNKTGIP